MIQPNWAPQLKVCTSCKIAKPTFCFHKAPGNGKYGVEAKCKPCRHSALVEHRQRNGIKRTRLQGREYELRYRYDLSMESYTALLASQGGGCGICGRVDVEFTRWHVDHCHFRGAIRGLLCSGCNVGLGMYQDNPELLRKAAEYLEARS